MAHWSIYRTHDGELCGVEDAVPNLAVLAEQGLAAVYFGEDRPDVSVLSWCPKRLTWAAKAADAPAVSTEERIAALSQRLHSAERLLDKLTTAAPAQTDAAPAISEHLMDRLQLLEEGSARIAETLRAEMAQVTTALQGLTGRVDGLSDRTLDLAKELDETDENLADLSEVQRGKLEMLDAHDIKLDACLVRLTAAIEAEAKTRLHEVRALRADVARLMEPKPTVWQRLRGRGE